ncbi:hypothetical protein P4O66_011334, partial [Electrophorus voltai]
LLMWVCTVQKLKTAHILLHLFYLQSMVAIHYHFREKKVLGSDEQLQKTRLDGFHDIEASKEQLEMERCNLEV